MRQVVQAIQPLDRLRRMADEDSVEDYVMCYTSVLQARRHPGSSSPSSRALLQPHMQRRKPIIARAI